MAANTSNDSTNTTISTRKNDGGLTSGLFGSAASLASMMLASSAAAQDSGATEVLPTIEINAEGGGYQAPASGLTRMPTPLRDTPQSVTVVPRQIITEQNATTIAEALRNVPGITFRAGEGGNQGDSPIIRGFDAKNDMFRDGVRDPGWYTRDTFSVDAVEVLKGPASFLFGRGSTGGVINLVTKTPTNQNFVDTEVIGNTGPGIRATVDANGKLNENVAARIQVMGQRYDTPARDHVEENRAGIAPSLSVKITDQTKATLSYIYQHDDSVPDRGIPFLPASFGTIRKPVPVPRETWYGVLSGANPDQELVDAHIATAKIEHSFTDTVKITNTTRYVSVDRTNITTLPQGFNPTPANLATYSWKPGRQNQSLTNELFGNTTDLSAKFATGTLLHQFVAGVDYYQESRNLVARPYQNATAAAVTVFNPDPNRAPGVFGPPGVATTSDATTIAAYVADQIKINEYFEILGGLRYDNFRAESGAGALISREDDIWSYRVGGIFHPNRTTSIYVMHGTSANPSAEFLTLSAANADAGPEKNETTEVGVKTDVLNGQLSLSGAVFRTDKTNARVPDPTNTAVNILAGVTRVQGFELGAVGKLTDRWSIFAGYTHLTSDIISTTTAAQLGKEMIGTPNNSFSLWTTYALTDKATVGGGAFYVGDSWADANNTALVPAYWRFDLMAAYKVTPNATLQVNIYNLTDEYYFASAYSGFVVPAPGRSASLSLKMRW